MHPNKNTQHHSIDHPSMKRRLLPTVVVLSSLATGLGLNEMHDNGVKEADVQQTSSAQPVEIEQDDFIKGETVYSELPRVVKVDTSTVEEEPIIVPWTTTTMPLEQLEVQTPPVQETTTTIIPTPKPILPLETVTTAREAVPDVTLPKVVLPETTIPDTIPEEAPDTIPEVLPVTEVIPETTQELLSENTVYIPDLGCSGYLIKNQEGKPIGVATAEHCGLRDNVRPRLIDADGVLYTQVYQQFDVYTGDTISELESVATVASAIVPEAADESQDLALLVFEGEDPKEVYEAFDEAPVLSRGDVAYLSGWPIDQDDNTSGEERRQEWAMDYLGEIELTTTLGETLEGIQLFALKSNKDGAECSFRSSGSVAITEDGTEIGALALFDEFIPDTWQTSQEDADNVRAWYEAYFGVDLSGYTNICGFSPKQVAYEDMELVELRNYSDDEGGGIVSDDPPSYEDDPSQPETTDDILELRDKALEQLNDPSTPKTYIDGVFEGLINRGGPGSEQFVENPLVYSDEDGDTLLYWIDEDNKSGYSYYYISKDDNPYITVNRLVGDTEETAFEQTSGDIEATDFNGGVALQDEQDVIFGHTIGEVSLESVQWYFVVIDGVPGLLPAPDSVENPLPE